MGNSSEVGMCICQSCGAQVQMTNFCPKCGAKREVAPKRDELVCPHCRAKVSADQLRCANCGKRLETPVYCPNCKKKSVNSVLPVGARFCPVCGVALTLTEREYYNNHAVPRLDYCPKLKAGASYNAQLLGKFGQWNYHLSRFPLLAWNDLLITVVEGAIYVFDLRVAMVRGGLVPAFVYEDLNMPRVPVPYGIKRAAGFPLLLHVVQGMLVVPAYDFLFLWDVIGNLRGEQPYSDQRGGPTGKTMRLQGQLCADLAVARDRFIGALVRSAEGVWLNVYELRGNQVFLYYKWHLGELPENQFTLFINSHYIYVLCQSQYNEPGRLLGFSLDNFHQMELEELNDRCQTMLCFDNEQDLFFSKGNREIGQVMRFNPSSPRPEIFLDDVVLPQCYRRESQGVWIWGRSLHYASGQRTQRFDDLDEFDVKMSFPPQSTSDPQELLFVNSSYNLASLCTKQNRIAEVRDYKVYLDEEPVKLNHESPWVAKGDYLYGFGDAGLLSIDLSKERVGS